VRLRLSRRQRLVVLLFLTVFGEVALMALSCSPPVWNAHAKQRGERYLTPYPGLVFEDAESLWPYPKTCLHYRILSAVALDILQYYAAQLEARGWQANIHYSYISQVSGTSRPVRTPLEYPHVGVYPYTRQGGPNVPMDGQPMRVEVCLALGSPAY
jgi:hypothetical protein